MSTPALSLPEANDAAAIADFFAQAPNFRKIWCNEKSRVDGRVFAGKSFPNIIEFSFLGCREFANADELVDAFPELQSLTFWTTSGADEWNALALAAFANASSWTKLRSLELNVSYRGVPFETLEGWASHWAAKTISLTDLHLSGLTLEAIQSIWQADFPNLVRLRISPALGDGLLDQLLERARLPELESLDVRFNCITGEGLQRFGGRARERFGKLRQIGVEFFTGEKDEDCDWNGGVVQSFDVQYSPEEITERYLKGTGIVVVKLP